MKTFARTAAPYFLFCILIIVIPAVPFPLQTKSCRHRRGELLRHDDTDHASFTMSGDHAGEFEFACV
ncbi:MAG: hypothetical protein V4458_13605, partial [Pseudomonadota bacterium]